MSAYYLSLAFCNHDSNIAFSDGQKIVLHLEAERVFRKKHYKITTPEEVDTLVQVGLDYLGISIEDVKKLYVTIYKNIYTGPTVKVLGKSFTPVLTGHHLNHVGTMYPSGFENALVVCADGGSEDGTTSIYLKEGTKITHIDKLDDTPWTGKFYGTATQMVINPNHWLAHNTYAGKLMGLSSLGGFNEQTMKKIQDNALRMNRIYPEGCQSLLETFGISENYSKPWEDPVRIDFAYNANRFWVEGFLNKIKEYSHLSNNIALVGGCALNIVLNSEIVLANLFENVYVSAVSSDSGQSIGAILYYHPEVECDYPFLGRSFGELDEKFDNNKLVEDLKKDEIIAWYQGASESGPRALGHRSFLGLPRSEEMRFKLSVKVKKRETYRPVAAIVRDVDVSSFFKNITYSPYMTFCADALPIAKKLAPAIVHSDNTTRLQIICEQDNPILYKTLGILDEQGIVPILMNSSYNVDGEPIVDTPEDALKSFIKSEADVLYINGQRTHKDDIGSASARGCVSAS